MSTPTEAEWAAAANFSCPFLALSNEIITSIVYELHPREAIFLSLTCRAFFHGVLSSRNYYLWYKVGRFSVQMPGHKAGWMLAKKVDAIKRGPASSQPPGTFDSESASSDRVVTPTSVGKEKGKAGSRKKPTRKELVEAVKSYSPTEVVADYKRLLVETMLGDTDTGCQWCLAKPMTRKLYESWEMRLCEGCFFDNVITKHACKPLNIDISHLPVQDVKRQGGVLHGVWKPAVQRLTDAKHRDGSQPVEEIIAEYKDKKQAEKDTAAEELAAYRERHCVAIFESIKVQYREIYEKHAKTNFTGSRFAGLLEKVPPEQLKLEWFMEPRQEAKRHTHPTWSWKEFCKKDPLMKELRSIKGGEKWGDVAWVEECAREKIAKMQIVLGSSCRQSDIPTCYMKGEISGVVKRWHIQRARDGGVQELVDKMAAINGKGLQCPWTKCRPPVTGAAAFESLENYIDHFRLYHWGIFLLGDTDWLIGRPSRWWLRNAPHDNRQPPGGTSDDDQTGLDFAKQEVRQAAWLQQWWPDRWKEENVQVLEGWRDNGGFYG